MALIQDLKTTISLVRNVENWTNILIQTIRKKKIENITIKFRKHPISLYIYKSYTSIRPHHLNSISADLGRHNNIIKKECYVEIRRNEIKLKLGRYSLTLPNDEYSLTFSLPRWIIFLSAGGKVLESEDNPLIEISGYKFYLPDYKNGIYEIVEMYIDEVYDRFDFKNKTILDVGASIGDSSIWFIHKGAKKVFAYEPNPKLYEILKKNIKINNLSGKIIPENYAVGISKKKAKMKIPWYGAGSIYGIFKCENLEEVDVTVVPINEILENKNIDIIKLDCEGCEYEILDYLIKSGKLDNLEGVVFECHYINNSLNPERMIHALTKYGYNCQRDGNIISLTAK
ncbi:FkbM family methyltransferase [Archaeoglobus profundus]|uniref:Methyltransferase FkbM family n=1 Tax=Archaeoglobus profundus (strain DSM 5631 / JCM 9629 / NBRC 100127 / Av18) TaxID=572546 RepID=D2RH11_ARCPA|nr:FkbM family methyltransferase [Archaeoglobus profundus]ADB57586.1 methyltransferase FkbM family [Archaeoglobus profundus DSM 5631]